MSLPDVDEVKVASRTRQSFAVIRAQMQVLDYLFLHRAGHCHTRFVYAADGALKDARRLQPFAAQP